MATKNGHTYSSKVIESLGRECNNDLESFLKDFQNRRKAYMNAKERRVRLLTELEDDEREPMEWHELLSLLEERELAIQDLRDEIAVIERELMLLKREMRRTRRKLLESGGIPTHEYEKLVASKTEPTRSRIEPQDSDEMPSPWALIKPWLRSFLPNSA